MYRILRTANLLNRWNPKPNRKGTGFEQPLRAHERWHVDIAYLNVAGTLYYLCSVLQRGRELNPKARPRIISDNGPQFIARDFEEFIRVARMIYVRTSPSYPQSNGKLERYNRTVKTDFRAKCPRRSMRPEKLRPEKVDARKS